VWLRVGLRLRFALHLRLQVLERQLLLLLLLLLLLPQGPYCRWRQHSCHAALRQWQHRQWQPWHLLRCQH